MSHNTGKIRIAAALAAFAALTLPLTACGGSDDSKASTSSGIAVAEPGGHTPTTSTAACKLHEASMAEAAGWSDRVPDYALIVTKAIDLPSQFSTLGAQNGGGFKGTTRALIQGTDGAVYAKVLERDAADELIAHMVKVVDGRLVSTETTDANAFNRIKQNEDSSSGYGGMRVIAANGIDIPAAVQGPGEQYRYLTSYMSDADDENIWFLAAGSNKLYQARVAEIDPEYTGDKIDIKACK